MLTYSTRYFVGNQNDSEKLDPLFSGLKTLPQGLSCPKDIMEQGASDIRFFYSKLFTMETEHEFYQPRTDVKRVECFL